MTNHHQVAYSKTKNFNKEYCSSREVAKKHLTESATCFFVFFTGCVAGSNRVCVYSKENAENECLLVWTSYTFHRRDDRTNGGQARPSLLHLLVSVACAYFMLYPYGAGVVLTHTFYYLLYDRPTYRPTDVTSCLAAHTPTLTIGWLAPPSPVHVHCAQQRGPAISQNHSQLQLFICIEPHSFSFTHKHYVFPRRGRGTATKHRR